MRIVVYLGALLLVLSSTGCFWSHHHHDQSPPPAVWVAPTATNAPDTNTFTITPAEGPDGRVASVNSSLEFVVLTFPVGQLPPLDEHLNVYRNGTKVGEVKITGPAREDNTVADIVSGGAIKGDEVREK